MDLALTDDQHHLLDVVRALYGRHSSVETVRAHEASGLNPGLWANLVELGTVSMAVDEAHGGWGASFEDLALLAEEHGRHLGAAPLIETQVAARLLARLSDRSSPAADLLRRALDSDEIVVAALHPATQARASMVPWAPVAGAIVIQEGAEVVCVGGPSVDRTENLGAMAISDVAVTEPVALAGGSAVGPAASTLIDEWMALTASALVGVGARALELAVDYAKQRQAFGAPIGSFQAIAHPLADAAAHLDGARLLARQAAWAVDSGEPRAAELGCLAFAYAAETARRVTAHSLHVHGGYGFTLEYDIQLYYRRARAWSAVFGPVERAYARAADLRYGAVAHGAVAGFGDASPAGERVI